MESHHHCPTGEDSWYYYQKRLALFESDPSNPLPTTRQPYLSAGEYDSTVEVFNVFGSLSFSNNAALGKTQNSNESLHNMLWHNSPKSKHVVQKYLVVSTALAVMFFNEGSISYSRVMEQLGINISNHTLLYCQEEIVSVGWRKLIESKRHRKGGVGRCQHKHRWPNLQGYEGTRRSTHLVSSVQN